MKYFIAALVTMATFFSCKKDSPGSQPSSQPDHYLTQVSNALKDSLTSGDFASIDFDRVYKTVDTDARKVYLRLGIAGKPVAVDFMLLETDNTGHVLKGRMIHREMQQGGGAITIEGFSYRIIRQSPIRKGYLTAETTDQSKAEEPAGSQDLPPVIITGYTAGHGLLPTEWYLLSALTGDDSGNGNGYIPANPGGGSGGGAGAPAMRVDIEYPEKIEEADIKKYIKCFGSPHDNGATYTVTIAVDLPVDNDPSKIFNWSDASPGHTFIELYQNGAAGLVQQVIGFYPNSPWKTVGGGYIASKVGDDGGHEYQAKYTITVNAAQFANALQAAQAYSNFEYNVAAFNCSDYALKIFTAAGGQLNVPPFPVPGYSDASNTPQGVYDAIQGLVMDGNANAMANGHKQWAGNSHGPCE